MKVKCFVCVFLYDLIHWTATVSLFHAAWWLVKHSALPMSVASSSPWCVDTTRASSKSHLLPTSTIDALLHAWVLICVHLIARQAESRDSVTTSNYQLKR